MSQSFFLRSINSDLSVGGALFNRKLLEDTAAATTQEVSLTQNQTVDAYAFTEPGIPGTDGGMGDYTVSIHITAGATQINVSSRLARVDSDGVVQAEGGFSEPDPGNAGVKVHEFESFSLGTWAAGDRLRVQYRFVNTDNMMTRALTIELNTAETEVITPWDSGEPDPAEAFGTGAVVAVGAGTGLTPTPAEVPEASGTGVVVAVGSAVGRVPGPELTVDGTHLLWDGVKLNPGSVCEGLPLNTRMVQATVDFSGEANTSNWDADANTAAFIAEIPSYRERGIDAISINFQGGNFEAGWGSSYDAGAFNPNGTIRTAHADRITDVIDALIANDIIPLVGLFYFRQDQILTNEAAVLAAVDNAKTLLGPYKDQIIVEASNESNSSLFDHDILKTARVHEIIDDLVADGFYATTSWGGGFVPTTGQMGDAQVILLHGNGRTIAQMEEDMDLALSRFPGMPIFYNEDNATGGTPPTFHTAAHDASRFIACLDKGMGWGFFDRQTGGWQYWSGVNSATPIDWTYTTNEVRLGVMNAFKVLSERTSTEFVTLSESWVCANAGLINCELDWTHIIGNFDIVSNTARSQTRGSRNVAVANLPFASEDMRVVATVTPHEDNRGTGPLARVHHTTQTYYYVQMRVDQQDLIIRRQNNATTATDLGTKSFTVNIDQAYEIELTVITEGSDARVIVKVDGNEEFNLLDTSPLTGNPRAGIRDFRGQNESFPGDASFDSFTVQGFEGASGTGSVVASGTATGFAPATFDPPDLDVTIVGTTAELVWSASPTPGVVDYQVFRRTPQTGEPFDPLVDTPVASGITLTEYDDEDLAPGDYDWMVFGRVPA